MEKAIDNNLRGYGTVRLSKLSRAELDIVARAFQLSNLDDESDEDLVKRILQLKKTLPTVVVDASDHKNDATARDDRTEKQQARKEKGKEAKEQQAEQEHESSSDDEDAEKFVVVPAKPPLRIISFNSFKLRVGDKDLAHRWLQLVEHMAASDVVLASEVPAGQAEDRVGVMCKMLSSVSGTNWSAVWSEPSGTQNEDSNKEVHVAFVKKGIKIIRKTTVFKAGGVALDYAPLQVLIEDQAGRQYVLTSVHFPPEKREKARDTQTKAFLRGYLTSSDCRMEKPVTAKGAKDARVDEVVHVIAGDFNGFPPEIARNECKHFSTFIGSRMATTAGGRSFDHFLVNSDAAAAFSACAEVLELVDPQNSAKGEKGLSDHFPIVLTLREGPRARR